MTASLNGACGTGASFTLLGGDDFGGFSLTTGTGSSPSAGLNFTVSGAEILNTLASTRPDVTLVPLNAAAKAMTNANVGSNSATSFAVSMGNAADSTTYQFAYKVD